jgi:chaperonin GroES
MKIIPTSHHICVAPSMSALEAEMKSRQSPLALPEMSKDKPTQGRIIEKGPGRILANGATCAIRLSVGQEVVFNRHAGTEMAFTEKDAKGKDVKREYIIISEDDVIAILEP